eukprot:PhM_4_TR13941/c0_g2_i2/m.5346
MVSPKSVLSESEVSAVVDLLLCQGAASSSRYKLVIRRTCTEFVTLSSDVDVEWHSIPHAYLQAVLLSRQQNILTLKAVEAEPMTLVVVSHAAEELFDAYCHLQPTVISPEAVLNCVETDDGSQSLVASQMHDLARHASTVGLPVLKSLAAAAKKTSNQSSTTNNSDSTPAAVLCQNCEAHPASVVCHTCRGIKLCLPCAKETHSARIFQIHKHHMEAFDALTHKYSMCSAHDMPFISLCLTCDALLCLTCATTDKDLAVKHRGHDIQDIDEHIIQELQLALRRDDLILENNATKVKRSLDGAVDAQRRLDASMTRVVNDISIYFRGLREKLCERERALLTLAQERAMVNNERVVSVQSALEDLVQRVDESQALLNKPRNCDDGDGAEDLLKNKTLIVAQAQARRVLLQSALDVPLPPRIVDFSFDAPDVDVAVWGDITTSEVGLAYEGRGVAVPPNKEHEGVFYYLGTSAKKYSFRNPSLTGAVRWSCSTGILSGSLDSLSDHIAASSSLPLSPTSSSSSPSLPVALCTQDEKGQTLELELVSALLQPTHYTLRHGGHRDAHTALRNWTFEAFDDQTESWVSLATHVNDASLNTPHAAATWQLGLPTATSQPSPKKSATTTNTNNTFRRFRIVLTGPNAVQVPRSQYHIHLRNVELYGTLYQ